MSIISIGEASFRVLKILVVGLSSSYTKLLRYLSYIFSIKFSSIFELFITILVSCVTSIESEKSKLYITGAPSVLFIGVSVSVTLALISFCTGSDSFAKKLSVSATSSPPGS